VVISTAFEAGGQRINNPLLMIRGQPAQGTLMQLP